MTRRQTLERLIAVDVPANVPAIEAALRAIVARIDTVRLDPQRYAATHQRLDDLLVARDRARDLSARRRS